MKKKKKPRKKNHIKKIEITKATNEYPVGKTFIVLVKRMIPGLYKVWNRNKYIPVKHTKDTFSKYQRRKRR